MTLYTQIDIATAIKENAAKIAELREKCATDIAKNPDEFNDDLFLLRFCLSHKDDAEKRCHALQSCCTFRTKHREVLTKIRSGERHPAVVELLKYCPFDLHKPLKDGSPIFIVRQGVANVNLVMEKLKPETVRDGILFQKEEAYIICDAESRKRGKIIKMISFSDFNGFGWSSFNRAFMGCLGEAVKETELVWPQLLGNSVMLNPPFFMRAILSVAQLLLPKSTLEKMRFCKGSFGDDVAKCPVASKVIDLDSLPTFLGGRCTCAAQGGCVAGIPNTMKTQLSGDEGARMAELRLAKVAECSITLKPKDYAFRVRTVLNSGVMMPAKTCGSSDIGDEWIVVPAKKRLEKQALRTADLGPFLVPHDAKGKPTVADKDYKEELFFILEIEKLKDSVGADVDKGILERKEKRVEIEFHPFLESTKAVDFGDTAEMSIKFVPTTVTHSSSASPLLRAGIVASPPQSGASASASAAAAPAAPAAAPAAAAAPEAVAEEEQKKE